MVLDEGRSEVRSCSFEDLFIFSKYLTIQAISLVNISFYICIQIFLNSSGEIISLLVPIITIRIFLGNGNKER